MVIILQYKYVYVPINAIEEWYTQWRTTNLLWSWCCVDVGTSGGCVEWESVRYLKIFMTVLSEDLKDRKHIKNATSQPCSLFVGKEPISMAAARARSSNSNQIRTSFRTTKWSMQRRYQHISYDCRPVFVVKLCFRSRFLSLLKLLAFVLVCSCYLLSFMLQVFLYYLYTHPHMLCYIFVFNIN